MYMNLGKDFVSAHVKEILKDMKQMKVNKQMERILNDDDYLDRHYGLKREEQYKIDKVIFYIEESLKEELKWIEKEKIVFKKRTRNGIYVFNSLEDKAQYQIDMDNYNYYWTRRSEEKL